MMTYNNFKKLRNEIVLNSLFLKDYSNSFYIKNKTVCAFFDSAIEYINDDYKEKNNKDIDICDITTEMLYDYYKTLEYDPLASDDCIAYHEIATFNAIGDGLYMYDVKCGCDDAVLIAYYKYSAGYGITISPLRWYKIKSDSEGDRYIEYKKHRYYLDNFIKASSF